MPRISLLCRTRHLQAYTIIVSIVCLISTIFWLDLDGIQRSSYENFDWLAYIDQNRDVTMHDTRAALNHYVKYGTIQKRSHSQIVPPLGSAFMKIQEHISVCQRKGLSTNSLNLLFYSFYEYESRALEVMRTNLLLFLSSIATNSAQDGCAAPNPIFVIFNQRNRNGELLANLIPTYAKNVALVHWDDEFSEDYRYLEVRLMEALHRQGLLQNFGAIFITGSNIRGPLKYRDSNEWVRHFRQPMFNEADPTSSTSRTNTSEYKMNRVGLVAPQLNCEFDQGLYTQQKAQPRLLSHMVALRSDYAQAIVHEFQRMKTPQYFLANDKEGMAVLDRFFSLDRTTSLVHTLNYRMTALSSILKQRNWTYVYDNRDCDLSVLLRSSQPPHQSSHDGMHPVTMRDRYVSLPNASQVMSHPGMCIDYLAQWNCDFDLQETVFTHWIGAHPRREENQCSGVRVMLRKWMLDLTRPYAESLLSPEGVASPRRNSTNTATTATATATATATIRASAAVTTAVASSSIKNSEQKGGEVVSNANMAAAIPRPAVFPVHSYLHAHATMTMTMTMTMMKATSQHALLLRPPQGGESLAVMQYVDPFETTYTGFLRDLYVMHSEEDRFEYWVDIIRRQREQQTIEEPEVGEKLKDTDHVLQEDATQLTRRERAIQLPENQDRPVKGETEGVGVGASNKRVCFLVRTSQIHDDDAHLHRTEDSSVEVSVIDCLRSLLMQSNPRWIAYLFLTDDKPFVTRLKAIVNDFQDSRIRYFHVDKMFRPKFTTQDGGYTATDYALDHLLNDVQCEWISLTNADNYYGSHVVENVLRYQYKANPQSVSSSSSSSSSSSTTTSFAPSYSASSNHLQITDLYNGTSSVPTDVQQQPTSANGVPIAQVSPGQPKLLLVPTDSRNFAALDYGQREGKKSIYSYRCKSLNAIMQLQQFAYATVPIPIVGRVDLASLFFHRQSLRAENLLFANFTEKANRLCPGCQDGYLTEFLVNDRGWGYERLAIDGLKSIVYHGPSPTLCISRGHVWFDYPDVNHVGCYRRKTVWKLRLLDRLGILIDFPPLPYLPPPVASALSGGTVIHSTSPTSSNGIRGSSNRSDSRDPVSVSIERQQRRLRAKRTSLYDWKDFYRSESVCLRLSKAGFKANKVAISKRKQQLQHVNPTNSTTRKRNPVTSRKRRRKSWLYQAVKKLGIEDWFYAPIAPQSVRLIPPTHYG